MILEIERENSRRQAAEAREVGAEREKTKEGEADTELKRGIGAGLSESELNEKTAAMVAEMIKRIKM